MPKLRFRAFNKEWEEFKLKDIAKMYDGTHQTPKYVQQGIPFYSVENVTANNFSKTKYIAKDIFEKENKRVKIEQGDILMTRIGDIGTAIYIDWNVQASFYVSLALIKPNKSYSGQYIAHYISTNKFQSELWNRTIHVAFPKKINLGEIGECLINIPCSSEQNQIAACLSLIDERIECQRKIIEGLTSFKSSVSKKIFSQELRFSSLDIKWRKVQLKEVCEKQSSNISANKIEDNFGDYLIYGASGKLKTVDFYEVEDDYISVVKDGAGVGRLLYCKGKSSVLGTLDIIKPKNGINPYFLYCFLLNIDFGKYITGSTIPHIYFKDYSNEIIEMPLIEEQIKIANFLSCIDQKINLEIALLQQLKSQKQYLLQQLFI